MAAAATIRQPLITGFPHRDAIASLEFSCDPFGPSFDEPILLTGLHPTTGLELVDDTTRAIPVSVTVYRRLQLLAFHYGAAASVMLSSSPSMASQSIPLMTLREQLLPYESQHVHA
jgi:hypothetical protein